MEQMSLFGVYSSMINMWTGLDSLFAVEPAEPVGKKTVTQCIKDRGNPPRMRIVARKKLVLLEPSPVEPVSAKRYLTYSNRKEKEKPEPSPGTCICPVCGDAHKGKGSIFCRRSCSVAYKASFSFPDGTHPKHRNKYYHSSVQALRRQIGWDLPFLDYMRLWGMPCHYCGDSLADTIGLDRVDSSGPYSASNVLPCCGTCNMMKRTMGYDVFIEKCGLIYARHRGKSPKRSPSVAAQLSLF